jgi:S1-C subfamily serine protease
MIPSDEGGAMTRLRQMSICILLLSLFVSSGIGMTQPLGPTISTSSPLQSYSAASTSSAALASVFRIICRETDMGGTGFLHKSGDVITAAHVTKGCTHPIIAMHDNTGNPATIVRTDDDKDLVLLRPTRKISAQPLSISNASGLKIGSEIAFWGFPSGYSGVVPMLSAGYLSGVDEVSLDPTKSARVAQWVVNAALNRGNSGGPVVLVETGEVIGVADNKIAPLSDSALAALAALQAQASGFIYTAKKPDGTTQTFSEGQVVAMVLEELRQQVQLVIGHAVMLGDLRAFLKASNIDP